MESNSVVGNELRSYIERIERLVEERQTFSDDIKDVYAELKGKGYIPKIVRQIISKRKKDKATREQEESILDTYQSALGM